MLLLVIAAINNCINNTVQRYFLSIHSRAANYLGVFSYVDRVSVHVVNTLIQSFNSPYMLDSLVRQVTSWNI